MGIKARSNGDHVRDRLAAELASIDPASSRASEIAAELARGFFAPRPEAAALDIERAVAVLLGDGDRPRYIAVPGGVSHPAASELRARTLDRPPAQLDALVAGELYLGEGGRLHLWPWYPEADGGLRAAAEARAGELGAELPERHLDDPFESAWYFKHTGEAALDRLFERAGIEPPRLEVAAIPVLDFGDAVLWEGGGRAPPAAAQLAGEIAELARQLEELEDPHIAELGRSVLRDLLARYIAAVNGEPTAPMPPVIIELAGEPDAGATGEDGEEEEDDDDRHDDLDPIDSGATAIRQVFAAGDGAAVVCDGVLVVVDAAGAVIASWAIPEPPYFCGAGLALFECDGWRALDLRTGEWRRGELDTTATFGGALMVQRPGEPGPGPVGPVISPDGRYIFEREVGIRRISDHYWVAGPGALGDYDDYWVHAGESPADRAPALMDPASLDLPGVAVTAIDGVTFTRRRRHSYQVIGDDTTTAFALAGDRWRALLDQSLRRNADAIARLPVKCFAAAFAPGGERLWLLLADHLVRVDWRVRPKIGALIPLQPIAAAARDLLGATP